MKKNKIPYGLFSSLKALLLSVCASFYLFDSAYSQDHSKHYSIIKADINFGIGKLYEKYDNSQSNIELIKKIENDFDSIFQKFQARNLTPSEKYINDLYQTYNLIELAVIEDKKSILTDIKEDLEVKLETLKQGYGLEPDKPSDIKFKINVKKRDVKNSLAIQRGLYKVRAVRWNLRNQIFDDRINNFNDQPLDPDLEVTLPPSYYEIWVTPILSTESDISKEKKLPAIRKKIKVSKDLKNQTYSIIIGEK